jgi:integrase/recombinase XerC
MGLNLGVCDFTLARVKGEKVTKYRDTSGINSDTFSTILATCDQATLADKRDYALLRLLWSNALRRAFVSKLSIGDFDRTNGTLKILGKGRGTQSQIINLGDATSVARGDWLAVRPGSVMIGTDPIFVALDGATIGHPITGDGIYKLVQRKAKKAGTDSLKIPQLCKSYQFLNL